MTTERDSDEDFSSFVERSFAMTGSSEDISECRDSGANKSLLTRESMSDNISARDDQIRTNEKANYEVEASYRESIHEAEKNIFVWMWEKWTTEILACLLAMAALAAIVITLTIHDGRPLPQWPFDITVNALVSVFAVILKGGMMLPVSEAISQLKWSWFQKPRPLGQFTEFDLASRGPWGSIKILWRCHMVHLTSIGAAITVLALASDPFIQQMVRYQSVNRELGLDGPQALMPRSNLYNKTGSRVGAEINALDLSTQAAVYKGVYDSYSPIKPTCSSGNCTFPEYRTLGMCSRCQDVSNTINKTCQTKTSSLQYCTWELDSGPSLEIPGGTYLNLSTVVSDGYTSFSENLTEMTKTQILGFTNATAYEVVAVECTLYPCVRTYTASVVQGETSETLLSTLQLYKMPYVATIIDEFAGSPMPCLINGTYYNASEFTGSNATNTIATYGLLPNNQTAYLPSSCEFSFESALGMCEYLATFLLGNVDYLGVATPDWLGQLVNETTAYTTFDFVNDTWNALAESLTVQIRQYGDASNSQPAVGTAYHTETYIEVRWAWLAYPASLLLLAVTFFAATVITSAKQTRHHVWKGSPLPLLLHGLDDDIRDEHSHKTELKDMDAMAKRLRVQIFEKKDGWRLVRS